MIGITLSLEQVKSAPPEVRRWIESEMTTAWNGLTSIGHEPAEVQGLTAYTREEALRIFEAIKGDFFAAQVFLEFGREPISVTAAAPSLQGYRLADIMHHSRLSGSEQLGACFDVINRAFQQIRQDGGASLFGFDRRGICYVLPETHQNINEVWRLLASAQKEATGTASEAGPSSNAAGSRSGDPVRPAAAQANPYVQ